MVPRCLVMRLDVYFPGNIEAFHSPVFGPVAA
jgi:hypothetical protein